MVFVSASIEAATGREAGAIPLECGLHAKARELAALIIRDPEQLHVRLRCDGVLAKVAQEKAQAMAERGHVSHIGGGGANSRVLSAGYPLDKRYGSGMANQVEAVAGGFNSAQRVWNALKDSPRHRAHLLGEKPLYRMQDEIGVGYVYDVETPHDSYWVVYIARKEDGSDEPLVLISKNDL
ncbi:CAP domain-containing protein [Ferrimonas pelagia]